MRLSTLIERWGLFAATVFLLIGLILANLEAGPVSEYGAVVRYAFWLATAMASFLAWWFSQWLLVSGRDRLTRSLLLSSCLLATLVFVPASLLIDVLLSLPETEPFGAVLLLEEWSASAFPVFAACMIASLPAWLSTGESSSSARATEKMRDELLAVAPTVPSPMAESAGAAASTDIRVMPGTGLPAQNRAEDPGTSHGGLLPVAVRGGVLRATADLQYVHLHSPEGITTVPGPMHRVIGLLDGQGLEVRRGEWIADRHVKQLKSVRGRWVVLLKDGQQVSVSRRRLPEAKERWGSTRYT